MKYVQFILASLLASATLLAHAEIVTGVGTEGTNAKSCLLAKDDAQRQARNNKSEVVSFGQCSCEQPSPGALITCQVNAKIEKK